MANIQQNINATLSLAGLFLSQSPYLKHKKEIDITRKQFEQASSAEAEALEKYTEAIDRIERSASPKETKGKEILEDPSYSVYTEASKRADTIAEQLMYLDPSSKNVQRVINRRMGNREEAEFVEEDLATAEEYAKKKAAEKAKLEADRLAASAARTKILEGIYLREEK